MKESQLYYNVMHLSQVKCLFKQKGHPVAYVPRALTAAEEGYAQIKKNSYP